MQKTMRFILEQQAQFTVDIRQLRESQSQLTGVVAHLAARTRAGFGEVRGSIAALVDAQIRTEERVKEINDHLTAKIDALVDAQVQTGENIKKTDETVRNLAELFDRQLRERGSGG